jgi:YfiH family protein
MNPPTRYPFAWVAEPCGQTLQSARLAPFARHMFTTRSLVLKGPEAGAGWAVLARMAGVAVTGLVRMRQVHGTSAVVIHGGSNGSDGTSTTAAAWQEAGRVEEGFQSSGERRGPPGEEAKSPHADMAMTDDPDVAIVVKVADCVPLLVADLRTGAVAAVHAGWRGTAAGIVKRAVASMSTEFGSRPEDLVVAIGPSIGPCCYQVGEQVLEAFRAQGASDGQIVQWFRPEDSGQHYRLDLAGANRAQLVAAGVLPANIDPCGLCTSCHPAVFHSYRRDGPSAGRLAGVIRARGCSR